MATQALSAVINQTTNAGFQAWITEIVTTLFTTLGVTQTADTGQINPATVTIPGAVSTSAGYVIGRFNDTLQSTAPIFFKLEFGTGSASVACPSMWLTVGTGSNGSGTITNGGGGAVTTRVALTVGTAVPASTTVSYTSRYCYIATSGCGILHMGWKYGAISGSANNNGTYGGFVIARSNDGNGNATGTGVVVLTPAATATSPGNSTSNGVAQSISFSLGSVIPSAPANGWESMDRTANIYGLATLVESSDGFVVPAYVVDPVVRYSAYVGCTLIADFAVATTSSFAIIGSTSITFISAGYPFGASGGYNGGSTTKGLVLPWQ